MLVQAPGLRIERIVSRGQASPPGFWYDQPEDEWILLVQGAARLRIQSSTGEEQTIELRPGDFRLLPAHQLHRVEWTTPDEATVWLAVFFGAK